MRNNTGMMVTGNYREREGERVVEEDRAMTVGCVDEVRSSHKEGCQRIGCNCGGILSILYNMRCSEGRSMGSLK